MRVWIVSCGILFVGVQVLQWAQEWIVPLPFYIIGGAVLAIASNYEKATTKSSLDVSQSPQPHSQVPLPPTKLTKQPSAPISFTIKPKEARE